MLASAPHAQAALLAPLEAIIGPEPPDAPSLPWLRKTIAAAQWRAGCGALSTIPLAQRLATAKEWIGLYNRHRPLSASLDARERGHADVLPLLAAQMLLPRPVADWFASSAGGVSVWPFKPLIAAALSLRMALDAAPHNFQLKLCLLHTYLCLGAPAAALETYRSCDVKQIQQESFSYLALPALSQIGHLNDVLTY